MTTRKSTKKPARRNASCGSKARKNPTTYARGFPVPFNRLSPRDWAHIRATVRGLDHEWFAGDEPPQETVMTSQGYVDVAMSAEGPYVTAGRNSLDEPEWPPASRPRRRATAKRSKRAAGAKRTRKVNQRSNPRRKATAKRSNPSVSYCASGARSLKKGLSRGGRASAKCRWDTARSNPRKARRKPAARRRAKR